MELFDWFFPEQAKVEQLRQIASQIGYQNLNKLSARRAQEALREDLGFLALALLALITRLEAKGVISRQEILEAFRELDSLDGVKDGGLTPDSLRRALGFPREERKLPPWKPPGKKFPRRTR